MSHYGDTPNFTTPSLCATCRCAQNITGLNENVTFCRINGSAPIKITHKVTTCSDYEDKRQPALWHMEKIAWRISPDLRRKTVGFYNPSEWRRRVAEGKEIEIE